jgi:hypothetical protein
MEEGDARSSRQREAARQPDGKSKPRWREAYSAREAARVSAKASEDRQAGASSLIASA